MRLQDQGIDDDDGGVGREINFRERSDNDGGVGKGRGIYDASKGSDTMTEVAGFRQRAQGI